MLWGGDYSPLTGWVTTPVIPSNKFCVIVLLTATAWAYDQLTLAKPPNLLPILGGFAFCCCLLLMNSLSKVSLANTSPTAPVMRALAPVMPPTRKRMFEALNFETSRHTIIYLLLQHQRSFSDPGRDLQRILLDQGHFPKNKHSH